MSVKQTHDPFFFLPNPFHGMTMSGYKCTCKYCFSIPFFIYIVFRCAIQTMRHYSCVVDLETSSPKVLMLILMTRLLWISICTKMQTQKGRNVCGRITASRQENHCKNIVSLHSVMILSMYTQEEMVRKRLSNHLLQNKGCIFFFIWSFLIPSWIF